MRNRVSLAEFTVARLRRPGPGGSRVLLVAGRTWLAGSGAPDEHRVPVRLLDRLWLSTRRGVELDVVCGVEHALKLLGGIGTPWNLARYDAVVLLPDLGRSALSGRLRRVLDRLAAVTRVLRVTPDPIVAVADDLLGPWPGRTEIRISPVPGECPAAMVADTVGAALTGVLGAPEAPRAAVTPDGVAEHLHRIAVLAADAFAVESAAIAVTTAGLPRTLAAVGPLDGPPCPRAAVAAEPTLVLDTWRDARFAGDPRLGDREQVRFLAAHPLEHDDGSPFGSLCVSDARPREADDFDPEVLRDLALLASAEIQYAGAGR
jgi:hypothetical protein